LFVDVDVVLFTSPIFENFFISKLFIFKSIY
jgi:hypothetical protein